MPIFKFQRNVLVHVPVYLKIVRGLPHLWVQTDSSWGGEGWYCLMCEWSHFGPVKVDSLGTKITAERPPRPEPGVCKKRPFLEIRRR